MPTIDEHQQLLEKLWRSEEREAFLRRTLADILAFSSHLTKTTDLTALYRDSNLLARNILKLDCSTLMLLSEDGNSLIIHDTLGFPASMIGTFALMEGQGLSTHVVKEKKAALVEDFHREQRFEVPPVIFREGIVSAICVPMLLGEQVFGVMIGHTRSRRTFTPDEVDLYQSLANQAAVAIKNVMYLESLRESESRFRTLIDHAADAIFLADQTGRLVDVNEQACLSLGYSRDELLALHVFDVDPLAVANDHQEHLWAGMLHNQPLTVHSQHRRKDGTLFPVEIRIALITLHGDGFIMGFARDISEREQAEEERLKLQDELSQAQKLESLGRLAGGVAHDFNNMLSVILGYADMLMDDVGMSPGSLEKIAEITEAAKRSADLTRQLLGFARKQTVTPKVLDLNETVAGMLKMLRRLIRENIVLDWQPGPVLWSLKIDPAQVDQILANLCVNAADAINGVGRISIETENVEIDQVYCEQNSEFIPGKYVKLVVSDNGCGMSPEVQELIFEPFYTTKGVGQGTGLGLATVYGIVRQNAGFIKVYSEPETGTTFSIYLPRNAEKDDEGEEEEVAAPAAAGESRSETILLVEDEAAVLELTQRLLEKCGHKVLAAATPGEAIRLVQEYVGEIKLLLTDVIMPEMNGRDLAQRVRDLQPELKVLYMSGYTANIITHHGILEEDIHFLSKPFSFKELSAKLQEVLH
ncbi:MAG: PAS domain S-box protein [Desulfobulbaceae bacterium]|nr:PAS domain S-box protein [Desulfobulbaceae bacterium]